MAIAWENNPAGICEDAPCCGCCGPQGDGRYDPDEPPELDDHYDPYVCEDDPMCALCGDDTTDHSLLDAQTGSEFWVCEDCLTKAGGSHKIAPLMTLPYGGFITNTEGY